MIKGKYSRKQDMSNPIAYLSKSDEDTMYFHQLTQYNNKKGFIGEFVKEVNGHCIKKHLEIFPYY